MREALERRPVWEIAKIDAVGPRVKGFAIDDLSRHVRTSIEMLVRRRV
jgi:hypothetical protein